MHNINQLFNTMEYGEAPESPAIAQEWLHKKRKDLFINGKWQKGSAGKYFDSLNPANAEKLAEITQGSKEDIDRAVKAAQAAQKKWWELGAHGRARYLYALARSIQKHSRLFAVLESLDNGKTIRETRDIDIPLVARHFYHHAGWAELMETDKVFSNVKPVGVVGQIIPWNFPLLMLAWKIAPALAMGNTVILKPAEFTSLTALKFAEICLEIGLPAGVVNIVTGDGETGSLLVKHPGIQKIAFTGSTEVGKIIRRATAGSGKKLSLELGGKSPFIVFEDADLDSVVEGVVDAIWFNQGQVCCAGSKMLVQESVADKMTDKLLARMETLRMGKPLDKCMDMGAIVDPIQLDRISHLVSLGEKEGAKICQPSWFKKDKGCFFPPTLCPNVSPASTIAQEEIFGPVLVTISFRTPSEAVELANNTRYGLAASIWSEDINTALDIAPKIKAGSIWINCTNVFDAACGFGGYRESGYGREGGVEGLREYYTYKWEEQDEIPEPVLEPAASDNPALLDSLTIPAINRTAKLYIGGKQVRPDSGYSLPCVDFRGHNVGEVGRGNRKDIRQAVDTARKSKGWTSTTAHQRAQVLYYIAENLEIRQAELTKRLIKMVGYTSAEAQKEFQATIKCIFHYAAWADKYDGKVHHPPIRGVTVAMPEAIGTMGIVCPEERPLLAFIATMMPPLSMGNRVIIIPSQKYPLLATDFYQILETSDLTPGAVNIVTGLYDELAAVLASHDDVDAIWYFGPAKGNQMIEKLSAENMKRTLVDNGKKRNWFDLRQSEELLAESIQIKNIWIPYGV